MSRRFQWPYLLFSLIAALRVTGQSSDVTQCVPDYAWSINSKGQTPCLVASYLESQCGMPTDVNAIPVGTHYLGPTFAQQDPCLCSTVTYSLVSACGGCQGRTFQNWTTWSQFCPKPDIAVFTKTIPAFVEVPSWALINVTLTENTFNPTIAQAILNGTSTTLPSSSSTSTSITPTQPTTTSVEPSNSSLADTPVGSTSSSSHSNAGAIAGGVVGGLVVIIIVGLFFLWRHVQRKRNSVQNEMSFDSSALVSGHQNVTSHTTGNTGYTTFTSQSPPVQMAPTPGPYGTPSLYTSPYGSDIGTARPITPATTGMYTTVSPGPTRRSLESVSPSMVQLGGYQSQPGYKGVPEIS